MNRSRITFWPAWGAYVLLVGAVSLLPGQDVPSLAISDKLAHFGAYLIMAAFTPWPSGGLRRAFLVCALLFLYGAGLELAQGAFTASRTPDVLDAVSNGAGVAAGIAARRVWDTARQGGRSE